MPGRPFSWIVILAVLAASIAPAGARSTGASFLDGYVTEPSGVDPFVGAVVSLELRLVPDGTSSASNPATVLVLWQTRTDKQGHFQLPARLGSLTLPAGSMLAPGRAAHLRVFALGTEDYEATGLGLKFSVDAARRVSIANWPASGQIIRVVPYTETASSIDEQMNDWYAELLRGLKQQVWPGGAKQARASYQPLLQAMSESCAVLDAYFPTPVAGCRRARADFELPASPMPQQVEWEVLAPDSTPAPAKNTPAPEVQAPVIITGQAEAPSMAGMKPKPPDQ